MKLASYVAEGRAAFGVVTQDAVITMSTRFGGRYPTLRAALDAGGLDDRRQTALGAEPDHRLADVRLLPVIPDPEKMGDIIATGTPEGVGHRRNPPLWMRRGDVLEVEISDIGILRTRVVDEQV